MKKKCNKINYFLFESTVEVVVQRKVRRKGIHLRITQKGRHLKEYSSSFGCEKKLLKSTSWLISNLHDNC